jgi:hypothetical protein
VISDSGHERLDMALAELRLRVAELNNCDKDNNDDARRLLTVAWCNYHAMARTIGLGSSHGQRRGDVRGRASTAGVLPITRRVATSRRSARVGRGMGRGT